MKKNTLDNMVNFTKEHQDRLNQLIAESALENRVIFTKFGSPLNVVELLHTTSISQLKEIKSQLSKKIEKLEEKDEWTEATNEADNIRKTKELVNLIIGWKLFVSEQKERKVEKEKLQDQLETLLESQKTPAEKIEELKKKIAEL